MVIKQELVILLKPDGNKRALTSIDQKDDNQLNAKDGHHAGLPLSLSSF